MRLQFQLLNGNVLGVIDRQKKNRFDFNLKINRPICFYGVIESVRFESCPCFSTRVLGSYYEGREDITFLIEEHDFF